MEGAGQSEDVFEGLRLTLARARVAPPPREHEVRINANLAFIRMLLDLPTFREVHEYRAVKSDGFSYDVGYVAGELRWHRLITQMRQRDRERGRSRVVRLTAEWLGRPPGTLVRLLASDARMLRHMGTAEKPSVLQKPEKNSPAFARVRTAAACTNTAG